MKSVSFRSHAATLFATCAAIASASAEGDQFLDGIGETALVSRYLFDGNFDDWSRNGLDASPSGPNHKFIEDPTFGKVLSLPGSPEGAFVEIPSRGIGDAVSFSVTTWFRPDATKPAAHLFSLGAEAGPRLGLAPYGIKAGENCSLEAWTGGPSPVSVASPRKLKGGAWSHLAAVLDAADQKLLLYIDGKRVASRDIDFSLVKLIDAENLAATRLLLGASVSGDGPRLAGSLYDVRVYRSALSAREVEVIRHNAISDEKITVETDAASKKETAKEEARSLISGLVGVPDVTVDTHVGVLPKLPYHVPGSYRDSAEGPKVRVLWPAPTDNRPVAKPGTYKITGRVPGTPFTPQATVRVVEKTDSAPAAAPGIKPFPLGQVVLLPDSKGQPTLPIKNRNKFFSGLLESNPDRFLYVFRDAFGEKQPQGSTPLKGWESLTTRVRGQTTGHYLTALAQAYASTSYDPELQARFKGKMDYMIDVLHRLSRMSGKPATEDGPSTADPTKVPVGPGKQAYDSDLSQDGIRHDYWNWGRGFISGYPPDQFIMLERGATYGSGNHQVWAPYYVLHKILTGLVDCYEVGGDARALEVAKDMGLWTHARIAALPNETRISMWNRYIAGEYGGMNEILARLHRITGDERFLEGAKLFDNTRFFFGDAAHSHGLARNVDTIRGRHSNQHIPQIIGSLETYRASGEAPYYHVAENFWDICEHSYMYAIGGVAGARNPANAECFTAQPDTLFENGFSEGGQNETCATYNLLKLSRGLFMHEPDGHYMDYYERALYNHILASIAENHSGNTYHVPLNPGSRKHFGNPKMDSFSCCNGTALESSTKLQDTIYLAGADDADLYVNFYVPSSLDWKARNVKLTQNTDFPYSDTSTITLTGEGEFTLNLRVPYWAKEGLLVDINGKEHEHATPPGTYLRIERTWNDGDRIVLKLPMSFHLRPLMDRPNIASIFYGPVLLAAEENGPRKSWRPVTLDPVNPGASITGDPSHLHFEIGQTKLKPFFDFYSGFHSVYLDIHARETGK